MKALLAFIQECVRQHRYVFTDHALTKHPIAEGFRPSQAIASILSGTIIEHYPTVSRCLTCGEADGLEVSKDYQGRYIHCVCDYDDIQEIVIITMYRPRSDEWLNHFTRRR